MSAMLSIRPLRPDDIPLIAEWLVELPLYKRYNLTIEAVHRMLSSALEAGDTVFVADAGSTNPACGVAWVSPRAAFGRSAYLRMIGVQAAVASQGIGGKLLDAAEQTAHQAGRDLFLLVSDFNTGAQHFYERHGYQQLGSIPGYVLPDVAELIFWKPRPTQ